MLNQKQINQKIASIRKTTATLRGNIQEVLVNASAHAYIHGDVTAFTSLFEATSGVNRKRIVKWIRANGFANLQKDGSFNVNKKMRKEADFEDGDAVIKYLTDDVPAWYVDEESAEAIVRELDVIARLKNITAQVQKEGTVVKHVNMTEYRVAMEQLGQVLVGEQNAELAAAS